MLPSVSTILAPNSSCSVNDVVTSVLPAFGVPEAAIPLQTGTESATFDTAEDADSESQEAETDPPGSKNSGWHSANCPIFVYGRGKRHACICLFDF